MCPNQVYFSLLPPANEVWGKVMSLHLCVILYTGGVCPGGVSLSGGGVTSGRYASYWNAFLFYLLLLCFRLCCNRQLIRMYDLTETDPGTATDFLTEVVHKSRTTNYSYGRKALLMMFTVPDTETDKNGL